MEDKIKIMLDNFKKYNKGDILKYNFGFNNEEEFDALIISPCFQPWQVIRDESFLIKERGGRSFFAGYEIDKENFKIAYIKTASGGCNIIDYLVPCADLKFKKLIFLGACGALKEGFNIGDICTPIFSVAGTMANAYLKESLNEFKPFSKVYPDKEYLDEVLRLLKNEGYNLFPASVFTTDSLMAEYTHLEEIKSFGTDLIEMETSVFYEVAKLFSVPSVAFLIVTDNSFSKISLIERTKEEQERYNYQRKEILWKMVFKAIEN